jgi:hypothetical protein
MATEQRELATLQFSGPLFGDHGLDLDVLPDLLGYKRLAVATAKELWRARNLDAYLYRSRIR